MEEVEREEEEELGEEEEEESPKELDPEEEEIAMAGRGVGFSALLGFRRKKEFAVEKSRFGVRLNSKKMEVGSAVSHSTRSQLQRHFFLGGCSVINEH